MELGSIGLLLGAAMAIISMIMASRKLAEAEKLFNENQNVIVHNKRLLNKIEMASFTSKESMSILYEGWQNMSKIIVNGDMGMAFQEIEENKRVVSNYFVNCFGMTPEQWKATKRNMEMREKDGRTFLGTNGVN